MVSWQVSTTADSTLPQWSIRLLSALDAADCRAESVAMGLSPAQLNWQPKPGVWSVGQCLEHLRIGNEILVPAISAALASRPPGRVDDIRLGWFSRWFIRNYIAPNPGGARARAPRKIEPGKHVDPSVVEAFLRSNQAARELAKRAGNYDVNRIRYINPFIPLLRFTVGTGLEIIEKHECRHLLQAEGVKQSPGFPKT
jgi:DinB family protein